MSAARPPRWSLPGWAHALERAEELAVRARDAADTPREGTRFEGFEVVRAKPTRLVLRGRLPGPDGAADVHVKVRRPRSLADGARARVLTSRLVGEGALLRDLAARGLAVPRAVAWSAKVVGGAEVLVLETVTGARTLARALRDAPTRRERRTLAREVGALLRAAHDAGWLGRDVHRENFVVGGGRPWLLDPGHAPLRPRASRAARVRALAHAAHGLAPDARETLAGLAGYAAGDRLAIRRYARAAREEARRARNAFWRGRARRATRDGVHFETFATRGARGVLSLDDAPRAWIATSPNWIHAAPAGSRPLKADGTVVVARLPDATQDAVLKRYEAGWRERLRVPRAVRAFRRAFALGVRGVRAPAPWLAVADASGAGVVVSERLGTDASPALDLDRATRPTSAGGRPPFAALPRAARSRALSRLGRTLRRLHDADVAHRDLKAPNLVAIAREGGAGCEAAGDVEFAVVDLDGVALRATPVPWSRRARDLGRLEASVGDGVVTRTDRARVLLGYLASFVPAPVGARALGAAVLRAAARKQTRASRAARRTPGTAGAA